MAMQVKCPMCDKLCEWEGNQWRPFCSERCRLIDLGAWIDGDYTVGCEDAPVAEEYDADL